MFKLIVLAAAVPSAYCMLRIARAGRRLARKNGSLFEHQRWTNRFMVSAFCLAVIVETFVWVGGPREANVLAYAHYAIVTLFFVIFGITRFRLTGVRNRRAHGPLAYTAIASLSVLYVTGAILLIRW